MLSQLQKVIRKTKAVLKLAVLYKVLCYYDLKDDQPVISAHVSVDCSWPVEFFHLSVNIYQSLKSGHLCPTQAFSELPTGTCMIHRQEGLL